MSSNPLSEQDYSSYLALKDYRRAIQLALAMAQPRRLLNLFEKVSNNRPRLADEAPSTGQLADMQSMTGLAAVDEVLRTLSAKDLVRLLKYVRDWNSRANTSGTAQRVLGAILRGRKGEDLRECFEKARRSMVKATTEGDEDDESEAPAQEDQKKRKPTRAVEELLSLQDWLDGIVPYTERHLQRLDRALVDTFMLDYVLGEMDGGILDGIEEIEEEGETGKDAMEGLVDMLVDELDGDDSESLPSIPEMEME
jgi:U3 small nucleolar RNA-associated protein 13